MIPFLSSLDGGSSPPLPPNDYLFRFIYFDINDFIELFSLQLVRENRLPYRRLEQLVARWPHKPKVADSSSAPASTVFFN